MSPKKQFKWSSHNPVIMTALDLLQPAFVLELGVGNFSTPLLLQSPAKMIWHIENDRPWLDHVQQTFSTDGRSHFRYHEISDRVNKSTAWSSLPKDLQATQHAFYENLADEISRVDMDPRLLFVDHFTCVRTVSINHLAPKFDWIIYHDAETPEVYDYHKIESRLLDSFDHYVLQTASSWTGMLIRRGMAQTGNLQSTMLHHCKTFGDKFGRSLDEFKLVRI